jgi:glycosidase
MKPVIYQLFVRLFGNRKSAARINGTREENGCGKFDDINEVCLKSLKDFGITHIWYTGIIEHAVAGDYSQYGIENDYPEIIKGRAGSPYAIKDYYDVNPDLANDVSDRMNEFEDLVRRSHKSGLRVIIDFVPNHLARVYKSDSNPFNDIDDFGKNDQGGNAFSVNNDFYYLPDEELTLPHQLYEKAMITEYRAFPEKYREFPARVTGNDCFRSDPGIDDWYETVKLNYGVDYLNGRKKHFDAIPPVWEKMRSVILFWAGKKVDGFRADMAEMVPIEFWKWLIASVRQQYPDILFIAEIYQPHLYREFLDSGGFDYLYDKVDFYESVRNVIEHKSGTREFTRCWQRLGGMEKYLLRFLENHDEQRIASRFFAGDPWKAIPGMVLTATMNSGPVLLYFGQEVGEPASGISGFSGDDGRTTIFDYWGVPGHQAWMSNGEFNGRMLSPEMTELRRSYAVITGLCRDYPLFSYGEFYDLMWVNEHIHSQSSEKIYAFLRYDDLEKILVILNFGDTFFKDIKLLIPEDICEKHFKDDVRLTNKISIPARHDPAEPGIVYRPGEFIFDIAPFSAMVICLNTGTGISPV